MSNYSNKCTIKLFDISTELIEALANEYINDDLTIDISDNYGDIAVTIVNTASNDVQFNNLISKINSNFASYIYADRDITLEEALVEMLNKYGKFVSCAESLTGGKIAARIVSVPGASKVFYEGLVTYNPAAKVRRLHVPLQMIEEHGCVYPEVARGMTLGLLSNKDVNYGFSTTGIAGPDSDEFGTPVGRVYIGYGDKKYVKVNELNLTGTREEIRERTVNYALFFMLRFINKYN